MPTSRRPHYPIAGTVPPLIAQALRGGLEPPPGLFGLDGRANPDALAGPGQTGHRHPDTSVDAGTADFGGSRAVILDAIIAAGSVGITSKELADAGYADNANLAGSRLQELRGERTGFEPLIGRQIDPDDRLVRRGGAAVHYDLDLSLTTNRRWETAPVRTTCPHCGHTTSARRSPTPPPKDPA